MSLKGGSIKIDQDANHSFCGEGDITAREIFTGSRIPTPPVVERLWNVLEKMTRR